MKMTLQVNKFSIYLILSLCALSLRTFALNSPNQFVFSTTKANIEIIDTLVTWKIVDVSETSQSYIIRYEYCNISDDSVGVYLPLQKDCCSQIYKVKMKTKDGDSFCYQPCDWIADVSSCVFANKTLHILPPNQKIIKHFVIDKNKLPKLIINGKKLSKQKREKYWGRNLKSFQLELFLKFATAKYSEFRRIFAPDKIVTEVFELNNK